MWSKAMLSGMDKFSGFRRLAEQGLQLLGDSSPERQHYLQEMYDYAAIFITVVWAVLLSQLPEQALNPILIAIPFLDLSVFGFFFMAGLIYLEKGEGILQALLLTALAKNKVEWLAVMKGMGIFLLGPFAAWFVPEPWQWLLGVFPTYWPVKAFWVAVLGGAHHWTYILIGLIYSLLWVLALKRRLDKILRR